MSDALPDDTWTNAFLSASPHPLQQALQKRQNASRTHVGALAELFKQRAAIEAQYSDSLAKLAKNADQGLLNGKGGTEWEKLGGEAKLWGGVVGEIQETSSAHSTLAAIIRTDFEQPIRDLPNQIVPWKRIGDQDASLEKALKDYEKVAAKLDKAQSKGNKAGKSDSLSAELSQITSNLSSLSPMVYTTYQRLDEERLRSLKEVVVRWATARSDMAQRAGERAEQAVGVLISWETPDEVTAVGRRLASRAGGSTSNGTTRETQSGSGSAASTPRSNRRLSTATAQTQDFSPRPQPRQNGSSSNLTPSGGSFAGGLKSMLSRRPTLGPSGRGRSGSNATSVRSGRDRDGTGFAAIGEDDVMPSPQATQNAPLVDAEGFSVAPADRHRSPWEDPEELVPDRPTAVGEASADRGGLDSSTARPAASFANTFNASPSASAEDLSASVSSETPSQSKMNLAMSAKPMQENETERQEAMEKMQQTLQMSPPTQPSRRQTVARGRRDVRNTIFAGAAENGETGYGGLNMPIPAGGLGSGVPPHRSTNFSGLPPTNGHTGPSSFSPPQVFRQPSSSSIGSNNPFESPALPNPAATTFLNTTIESGLRGAVMENVNVIMRDGVVKRLQITGEIHLSLRQASSQGPKHGPIHMRLSQFEALEKIAPNPTFVAQVPNKAGEYFLNSEALSTASASGNARGTLAFKYQVFVKPGDEAEYTPLTMKPAFLCKAGESRMILHYQTKGAIDLMNTSLVAIFGAGASVSNVQAKPAGGVWSAAGRTMTWDLGSAISNEGKVIAKFVTGSEETLSPQNVQATWTLPGVLSSGLGLEIVQGDLESDWTFSDVQKQTSSGKYLAEPVFNQ